MLTWNHKYPALHRADMTSHFCHICSSWTKHTPVWQGVNCILREEQNECIGIWKLKPRHHCARKSGTVLISSCLPGLFIQCIHRLMFALTFCQVPSVWNCFTQSSSLKLLTAFIIAHFYSWFLIWLTYVMCSLCWCAVTLTIIVSLHIFMHLSCCCLQLYTDSSKHQEPA